MQDKDYVLTEVPQTQRKSLWSLIWVLTGFTFFTGTMFAGGGVGSALPFNEVITVTIIGFALLAGYATAVGVVAFKTGMTTGLLSRFSFGDKGSKIVDVILGLTQVGWYAWGTATIAKVLIAMAPTALGIVIPEIMLYPLMVFFGFAFCYTAYKGYRGLEYLSFVAVPLMLIFILTSLSTSYTESALQGGLAALMPTTGNMTWDLAITMAFGTFSSGATQCSNWTRFAHSSKSVVIAVMIAFLLGNGLMFITGAIGTAVYNKPDVVDVLLLQGFPLMALLMLLLNVWTTQDNGSYNFGVAGCNMFRDGNRQRMVLIGAGIGTVLAIAGADEFLFGFLILLGTFVPPIGGIVVADYIVRCGKYQKLDQAQNPNICWVGILSYVVGSLAAYSSPVLPPVVGIIVPFVLYMLLFKMKK